MKVLLYDIETDGVDTNTANMVLAGFYSSEVEGFQYTTNPSDLVSLINYHDVIVGYNNKEFDDAIMKRYGANFYGKVIVDLMEIIHGKNFGNGIGRKSIMQSPDGTLLNEILHGKSLAETTKCLGGPQKIGEFDYDLFKTAFKNLSEENQAVAIEYLQADLDATKYIYEYAENFFSDFKTGGVTIDGVYKSFMRQDQIDKKFYLTSSVAALTYKIICNLANIEERYSNTESETYEGGFVAEPSMEFMSGDIYCLDFNSLYPHIMMQCNLYGRTQTGWKGTGICSTVGTYNNTTLAPVGKVLQQLFQTRLEYKKQKDERQYTIKIIINTIYGLLGNPVFASVADNIAAADCTSLGRQWINAARLHFAECGYTLLYTDTDSVYLADPFKNKKKMLECKDAFIKELKTHVPFPQDTFDMGVDAEIEFIAFFKGASGDLLKKNYMYLTKDKKLKIKGLPIIKSTSTALGQKIFNEKILPQIIERHKHKFQRTQIEQWIESELKQNLKLASVFYKVRSPDMYANMTQIQSQIAHKFGEGQYNLIKLKSPHTKGLGVNSNYIRIEDSDDIKLSMIDIDKTLSELSYFKEETQKTLSLWG